MVLKGHVNFVLSNSRLQSLRSCIHIAGLDGAAEKDFGLFTTQLLAWDFVARVNGKCCS